MTAELIPPQALTSLTPAPHTQSMQRSKEIALLSECLALAEAKKPFMEGEETLVPVSKYVDEARFAQEREVLFRGVPNLAAHVSQLPNPGDFITREVGGTPVLLARDSDGRVRAFLNVCRHRGATVELKPRGHCKRFVCPYHAWTYRLDGRLDRIRHQDGFPTLDISSTSLVQLPSFEAAGFIWIVADASGQSDFSEFLPSVLLDELVGLGCEDLEVFDSTSQIWQTNWKFIVDGGLESYHFKIAHRDTIAGFFLDNGSTFEFMGDHIRSVLPRTSLLSLKDRPQSEWKIRDHTNLLYSLFPNASLLVQADHIVWVTMTPLAVDQTRIDVTSLVPSSTHGAERAEPHWRANHDFTVLTLNEDFEIAQQIQRGAKTGANAHYRLARFESALSRWHKRADVKLAGAD